MIEADIAGIRGRSRLMVQAAASAIMLAASLLASPAQALPTGPTSTNPASGGTAPTIATQGSKTLNVTLGNTRTIIDWTTFSIASGETVNFLFPSKSSIVLNRVPTGSATISGALNGCVSSCPSYGGNIWIYAPGGVLFGSGAAVNTGGLLATTSPMTTTDSDFVAGTESTANQFTFGASAAGASVDIQGGASISGHGGTLAFIAPTVTSEAGAVVTTTAASGGSANSVLYGAAGAYTIHFLPDTAGDLDLIDFIVPAGSESTVSAPIALAGSTSSGNIYIAAVSNLADAMITTTGSLTATSAASVGGNIVLSAGGGISGGSFGTASGAVVDASLGAANADQAIIVVASGGISVTGNLTSTLSVNFSAGSSINQNGGFITTGETTALAGSGITLTSVSNDVASLGFFGNRVSGGISFTDSGDFALTGSVTASGQTVQLTSSAGAISQTGGGITAGTLFATAATGISLTGSNAVTNLGGLTNPTGGIAFTNTGNLNLGFDVAGGGQTVSLASTSGALTQSPGEVITADTLNAQAATGVTLNNANAVTHLGVVENTGSGGVQFTDLNTLDLSGNIIASGQTVSLTSSFSAITQSAGAIAAGTLTASAFTGITLGDANVVSNLGQLTNALVGGVSFTNGGDFGLTGNVGAVLQAVSLTSKTGAITQTGGAITANSLTASGATGVSLTKANQVTLVGALSNSTSGGISFADSGDIDLTQAVTATGQAVSFTANTGAVSQTGGTITAGTLNVSAANGVALEGANAVSNLGSVSNSASGGVSFTNNGSFGLTGAVVALGQTVSLTSTTGAITQTAGAITADVLTASAVTGLSLTDANTIGTLGTLSNSTSGGIAITTTGAINLSVNIDAAGQAVSLTSTTGTLTQAVGETITAGSLNASAVGGITLTNANSIGALGAVSNAVSGGINIVGVGSYNLTGAINAAGQTVSLTSNSGSIGQTAGAITSDTLDVTAATGISLTKANAVAHLGSLSTPSGGIAFTNAGVLDLTGDVTAVGQTVSLVSRNASISQSGGIIAAALLTASAASGIVLDDANAVGSLGTISNATSGGISFSGAGSFTLTDNMSASGQTVTLVSTGGSISQSGGVITAATLTGSSATATNLGQENAVGTLENFTTGTDLSFVNAGAFTAANDAATSGALALSAERGNLTVGAGGVLGGASAALAAFGGDLLVDGNVTGPSVGLVAFGAITQTSGSITAAMLSGSAGTSVTLNGANAVGTIGTFIAGTNFSFTNATGFTAGFGGSRHPPQGSIFVIGVTPIGGPQYAVAGGGFTDWIVSGGYSQGSINGGGSVKLVASSGNLTLAGDITGTAISLESPAGGINQSSGVIIANTLNGSAALGISLDDANGVDRFTAISNSTTGGISVADYEGLTVDGDLSAPGQTVSLISYLGAIDQAGGTIAASILTSSAATGISLNGANAIANLGAVSNSLSGGVSFTEAGSFGLTDNLTAAGQVVSLVSTTGAINQTGGVITAGSLAGSAVTGFSLNRANVIGALGAISNTTSGGISVTNAGDLALTGDLTAPTQIVNLVSSSGAINQTGGIITADTLSGAAGTSANFNSANRLDPIGPFVVTDGFSFTSAVAFTAGGISAGGAVKLTALAGDLTLTDGVSGASVSLSAPAGAINQTGGIITTGLLSASATKGVTLNDANAVGALGGVSNASSGGISFTNAGDYVLSGDVSAPGQAVSLVSTSGSIGQTGGIITAATLSGSSGGAISLNDANAVPVLLNFEAGGGFSFTSAGELRIPGTIKANNSLKLTTQDGDLLITGVLEPLSNPALTVSLTSAAGSILIGDPDFVQRGQTFDNASPSLVNVTHNQPSSMPVMTPNETFISTAQLAVSAHGNILQQNTSLVSGRDAGVAVTGGVSISGSPKVVDLFLALGTGGSLVDSGVAATSGDITSPRSDNYRVNSCVIGEAGVCTVLSDAIVDVHVDNLTEDLLLKASPQSNDTDPTITGAGNEEIWRKRSR